MPTLVRVLLLAAFVTIAPCPARADDAELVRERLFQAKKEYDAAARKFRAAVGEAMDKREDDARKAGNKKLVDQIKTARDRFEKSGEPPALTPPDVLAQIKDARTNLDKAYATAIKDYTRLKEDTAAEATDKEHRKFQFESALQFGKRTYLVTLKHYDVVVQNKWFTNNGTQAESRTKLKLNGELVPHSIFLHPPGKGASQVRYSLAGKWAAFRATVGVPKIEDDTQPPASPLTFEVVGDGKSLWKSEPVTKIDTFQTCELSVTKVKVLTLIVHCPDANNWARAVWFEPVLME